MENRALTRIALLQTSIVVCGYLAATVCIKTGHGVAEKVWGYRIPLADLVVWFRACGLWLLLVPLIWLPVALWTNRAAVTSRWPSRGAVTLGGSSVVSLFLVYFVVCASGLYGPPQPSSIMHISLTH
jgi:hypothetical protein